ncbi:MAG: transposase [Anaerolineae bacterium]
MATDQNAAPVARKQVSQWLRAQARSSTSVPADQTLIMADSRTSTPPFIYPLVEKRANVPVRLRNNRIVYSPPKEESSRRGHPRWYGQRFALSDPATWPKPDVEEEWTVTSRRIGPSHRRGPVSASARRTIRARSQVRAP